MGEKKISQHIQVSERVGQLTPAKYQYFAACAAVYSNQHQLWVTDRRFFLDLYNRSSVVDTILC